MSTVSIELDDEQARRLKELAASVRRSEQDLCRDAVQQYLKERVGSGNGEKDKDAGYAALRAMIGLVRNGPTDLSVEHDHRPDDPR